mmetsp:Transcript_7611/g.30127  ORF Transcript_7611/g.30127 Transcript_7611/m.30127 type:complete len:200 (-) Transcript_7611:792-1391(-)
MTTPTPPHPPRLPQRRRRRKRRKRPPRRVVHVAGCVSPARTDYGGGGRLRRHRRRDRRVVRSPGGSLGPITRDPPAHQPRPGPCGAGRLAPGPARRPPRRCPRLDGGLVGARRGSAAEVRLRRAPLAAAPPCHRRPRAAGPFPVARRQCAHPLRPAPRLRPRLPRHLRVRVHAARHRVHLRGARPGPPRVRVLRRPAVS